MSAKPITDHLSVHINAVVSEYTAWELIEKYKAHGDRGGKLNYSQFVGKLIGELLLESKEYESGS